MSTPSVTLPTSPDTGAGLGARVRALAPPRPELIVMLVLAAFLNLWSLDQNGYANDYYSAAVHSMTQSWSNFFFGSFDAAGVMTVDKPPLALWVQAASAKAFGFSSWSILIPQALMGVATVGIVYDLVARRFGRLGGAIAGFTLALTPIAVALSRHNNPDALLALCGAGALWFLVKGLEDGRTRWLVLSGVCIGLGFEAKMAAALLLVPAMAAAYLWVAPAGRWKAVRQLAAGGAAMVAVGLAWPVAVWLTPASSRPWISGTSDNSIWSLIFGYNGLGRLFGQQGGPGGGAGGGPGGGGGGMGGVFGGDTGALRLLNDALAGQAGWLLGFALAGGIAVAVASRLKRGDARTGWIIAVGGSALTMAVAFSRAQGIFHPYYVGQLAGPAAALVGAGAATIAGRGLTMRVVAPLVVAVGLLVELIVIGRYDDVGWATPIIIVGALGAAVALSMELTPKWRATIVAAFVGLLLLAPASWAVQTLGHSTSSTFPAGGPASASMGGGGPGGGGRMGAMRGGMGGMGGGPGGDSGSVTQALTYVRSHGGGNLAISGQNSAGQTILQGDADNLVAIGGFSGRESQVTASWLADAVESGKVRWVLADGSGSMGMPNDGRVGSKDVMSAVQQTCTAVGSSSTTSTSSSTSGSAPSGLYDCQGKASALRGA